MGICPRGLLACMVLGMAGLTAWAVDGGPADGKPQPWGDLGDGFYANPILPADFSDIDCIRVDDTFVAMTSTFQFSPGVAILTSRDLVNWKIVGHAVPDVRQISAEMNWDRMNRAGKGVWAGAIRYREGKYWVYFGTPDEGYFMTTSPRSEGPWEPLRCLLKGPGWDDCCPFWDDDGQGYLVGTRFAPDPATGKKYAIHLWKLTPDGAGLIMESDRVLHQSPGSEANKFYKINGLYYHYYSEIKREGRVVMMGRAKSLDGPWERRQLNHSVGKVDPNQGGLVELADGTWWFFTHFGSGQWPGRMGNLLPVTWTDGWPIIGEPGADGIGGMVWRAKKPIQEFPASPRVFDETFDAPALAPEWEWNYHPRAEKWSLADRSGFLRLKAFKPLRRDDIRRTGNCLTQRIYRSDRGGEVLVKLDLSGLVVGQAAGLCFFSGYAGWIGAIREGGATRVMQDEQGRRTPGPVIEGSQLWLRAEIRPDGLVAWSYALDGATFVSLGEMHRCGWSAYRGTRIGIFTYNNNADAGFVDVDAFRYAF